MASPGDVALLVEAWDGQPWPHFHSRKRCEMAFARIQGRPALVALFHSSPVILNTP
jgi:hypothetical protein